MKTSRCLRHPGLLISWLLALPAVVQAQFTFVTNADNTLTITSYAGSNSVVIIPDTTNGYPIASIGDNAFVANSNLTRVTIPDSVTSIGDTAFWGCVNLAGITIPDGVTQIGAAAFNSCFGLTRVTIPASVTSIGDYAFVYCTNLTAITVDPANPAYRSAEGVLFNKDRAVLMQFPSGKAGSYWIPDGVTNLADEAFGINDYGQLPFPYFVCAGLTNLVIPGSIHCLGDAAFSHCPGLIHVTIDDGVTSMGTNAFSWCDHLTSITIPPSVTSIGSLAFYYSGLASVTIPGSVTNLSFAAFGVCSALTNVTLQAGILTIGDLSFNFCTNLAGITLPDSVTSIGDEAFWYCTALTNALIPDSVTNIGAQAFSSCASLMDIEVSAGNPCYRSVDGVLYNQDETTLIQFPGGRGGGYVLPTGVTNICASAFGSYYDYDPFVYYWFYPQSNPGLTTLTIPSSVVSVGGESFDLLTNLTGIYFEGDAPADLYEAFGSRFATFYYLPENAGWDENSTPWLPALQTFGANPAVPTNSFAFNINWARGQTVVVEACTNLFKSDWQPLQTNTLITSSTYFSDPAWTDYPSRYYRLRSAQ